MKTSRIVSTLLSFFVAFSVLSTMPANAAAGGTVKGVIKANAIDQLDLCARACQQNGKPVGSGLGRDEYYPTNMNYNTGAFSTKSVVEAGKYKIFFSGGAYGNGDIKMGYLKDNGNGTYSHVSNFSDASFITVEEGQDLNLGTLNLQTKGSGSADIDSYAVLRAKGYGGTMREASLAMKAKAIPQGGKVIVKSFGCGKRQTVKRYTKSGTYNFTWRDGQAFKHYGDSLRLVGIVRDASGKQRVAYRQTFSTSSFGWRC